MHDDGQLRRRVIERLAHFLADLLHRIEGRLLLGREVVLQARARQILRQRRPPATMPLVTDDLRHLGRQWQAQHFGEQLCLSREPLARGPKVQPAQIQDLLVQ